ncbi:MAG TPA: hypothetical protein DD381_06980 [Lentisphaeria bacterium]|nr:MAG: hypothetical protein A2X47_10930 [Lentisphaerae bacterium GWF2_38_69]HBM16067.1 hypothetical protein [Lentisphaeria bacterium]
MAVISKPIQNSAHWYKSDATPFHSVPKADGSGDRVTTLTDARKMGLYPSVTSINGVFAKPQLEQWKVNQAVLATLKYPKTPEETEEFYCKRIASASMEQVSDAADLGSKIHAALELGTAGQEFNPELKIYVDPVLEWFKKTGIEIIEREKTLVNLSNGFAGTTDVLFRYGNNGIGILDYKTRKTTPGEKVSAYDGQAMQLAAYASTYFGEENISRVLAANIFISSTEPGRFEVIKHTDLLKHWQAFKLACALWRYTRNYDPRIQNKQ